MPGKLEGKIAVVTGGGMGIGRAIAQRLAADGAKVVIGTRTAANGQETVDLIQKAGGQAYLLECDIVTRDAATSLVRQTEARYGALDILVHNAGFFPFTSIRTLTDDDLNRTLDVNLKACFWLVQAALDSLTRAAGGGRILITSSVSGNHANAPGLTHYSASKAGVTGFVRNLALDLAPLNITVNAVEPGFILTERNRVPEMEAYVRATVAQIPMRRGGTPMDIGHLMAFLASSEAAYVTGQSIVVDGGLTLGTVSTIGADVNP